MIKYRLIKNLRKQYQDSFIKKDIDETRKIHKEVYTACDRNGIKFDVMMIDDKAFDKMPENTVLKNYTY